MSIQIDIRSGSAATAQTSDRVRREFHTAVLAQTGTAASCPESNRDDPEKIVGELVNNYLRCSTTMSGIFFCW